MSSGVKLVANSPQKKPTRRQRQLIDAIPGKPSIAQAAESVEMTRQSAYRMLSDETVHDAVAKAESDHLARERDISDGTVDLLRSFEQTHQRAAKALSHIDGAQLANDPVLAANIVKLMSEAREKEHVIRERFGDSYREQELGIALSAIVGHEIRLVALEFIRRDPGRLQEAMDRTRVSLEDAISTLRELKPPKHEAGQQLDTAERLLNELETVPLPTPVVPSWDEVYGRWEPYEDEDETP